MTIGEQIRTVRKHLKLTQKELGQLSGTSETTIRQYESGKRQPRIEQLQKIAYAFGGSISDIFIIDGDDNEDMFTNHNLSGIPDILNDYTQELGEFLYYNPKHKPLFDSVMEVKPPDIEFANQMLNRINGKIPEYRKDTNTGE